jgi:putative membrane protein
MLTTMTTTVLASGGDHGWWPLWPLLWIAVIGTAVWLLVRRRGAHDGPRGVERAREILAERYARGEITSDEYRERLEQLR